MINQSGLSLTHHESREKNEDEDFQIKNVSGKIT